MTRVTRRGNVNLQKGRKKTMNEENITIVLNALADKIRMLEWEKKCLQERIDALVNEVPTVRQEEIKLL